MLQLARALQLWYNETQHHPSIFIWEGDYLVHASKEIVYIYDICNSLNAIFQKMAVKLGDVVPNFNAASTHGKIDFHTWCEV